MLDTAIKHCLTTPYVDADGNARPVKSIAQDPVNWRRLTQLFGRANRVRVVCGESLAEKPPTEIYADEKAKLTDFQDCPIRLTAEQREIGTCNAQNLSMMHRSAFIAKAGF